MKTQDDKLREVLERLWQRCHEVETDKFCFNDAYARVRDDSIALAEQALTKQLDIHDKGTHICLERDRVKIQTDQEMPCELCRFWDGCEPCGNKCPTVTNYIVEDKGE